MEQDGNFVSGSDAYLYNGKELNEDLGLGWYDYGARWYMADVGRWGVVDPIGSEMPSWSPYTYTFNNPLKFIGPDGKRPYNTIFVDETGAELFRTKDNLPNGIVVVNSENVYAFNHAADAYQNANQTSDSDISRLRIFRDAYHVAGLEALWSMTVEAEPVLDHPYFDAPNGNNIPLQPEYAANFDVTAGPGSSLILDLNSSRTANDPDNSALGVSERPVAHTHPPTPSGEIYQKTASGYSKGTFKNDGPSEADSRNAASSSGHPYYRGSRNVIVSSTYYLLYDQNAKYIRLKREKFLKTNTNE